MAKSKISFQNFLVLILVGLVIIFGCGLFYNAFLAHDISIIPHDPHVHSKGDDHSRPLYQLARSNNNHRIDSRRPHMITDVTKMPVTIIARHGSASAIPENTMAAFRDAVELGLDIKTDLRWTKDGHIALFENARLEGLTNGFGPVLSKTLAELQQLDILPLPPRAGGRSIPSLEQLCELVHTHPGITLYLEVKEDGMGRALRAALRKYELLDRTVVCFNTAAELHDLKDNLPEVTFAMFVHQSEHLELATVEMLADYNVHTFIVHKDSLTPRVAEMAHAHNARVLAFPVTDADVALLRPLKVKHRKFSHPDGVLSSMPRQVLKYLGMERTMKRNKVEAPMHKLNQHIKKIAQMAGSSIKHGVHDQVGGKHGAVKAKGGSNNNKIQGKAFFGGSAPKAPAHPQLGGVGNTAARGNARSAVDAAIKRAAIEKMAKAIGPVMMPNPMKHTPHK